MVAISLSSREAIIIANDDDISNLSNLALSTAALNEDMNDPGNLSKSFEKTPRVLPFRESLIYSTIFSKLRLSLSP